MSELIIRNDITIDAPAKTVWDVLTNPEQTKKYMHGCAAMSDWSVGNPLLWQAEWEGKEMVFVKGSIVAIKPGKYLAYTSFDPNNAAIPDVPENYLTVTYTLQENFGVTELTVTQGDYKEIPDGEKRYSDATNAGGWDSILTQIKDISEGVLSARF